MINNCLFRRFILVSDFGNNREITNISQRFKDTRAWTTGDDCEYLHVYIHSSRNLKKPSKLS